MRSGALGVDRVLEVVVVFTIAASLIGLVAALAGVFHAPQVLLASLLAAALYAWRTRGRGVSLGPDAPRWRHLALLVLVALFFRVPAYNYVLGGQDEGLYTNIAQHIEYTGSLASDDTVMRKLEGSPYLQRYFEDNRVIEDGLSPTLYLAGVYARPLGTSKLTFQFYYLFPVWMALFGGLLGTVNAVCALTFFSILSIVFFYRLTLILTRSTNAALVAGGLLALNPLHAFFSKFPVTEVPTLAFSLIGFACLACYWAQRDAGGARRCLWLSVLAFFCLFATRISGLMYVPIFIAMAMAALVCDRDAERVRRMQAWALAVTVAYLVSVAGGFHWSKYYSRDQYLTTLEPMFGQHWKRIVEAVVVGGLLLWVIVRSLARRPGSRDLLARWVVRPLDRYLGWIVAAAVLAAVVKIYWLGWTGHYAASGAALRFSVAGHGWRSASASTLWALIVYVGPLVPLAFLALLPRRQADPRMAFLRWFAAGFFCFSIASQWITFYSPYYARYLLSETLPYVLLFVVCAWAALPRGPGRTVLSAALAVTLVYSMTASAFQVGKNEDAHAYSSLARLLAPVGPNDVVLLDTKEQPPDTSLVKTPLVYTFHHNVVTVGPAALSDSSYLARLNELYDDVFLVSASPALQDGFEYVNGVRFDPQTYRHTHFFPRRLEPMVDTPLFLYRLAYPQVPAGEPLTFEPGQPWGSWLRTGWSAPEAWGVWSDAENAVLAIDPRQLATIPHAERDADATLRLTLHANVFVAPTHPTQRISVSVDGRPAGDYQVTYPTTAVTMVIALPRPRSGSRAMIEVRFGLPDAVSPHQVGVNGDPRQLALGLVDAVISPGVADDPAAARLR